MPKKTEKQPLSDEAKLMRAQKRKEAKNAALDDAVKRFDSLPDKAHVRLPVVMALYGCSAASIWRFVQSRAIPAPRKFGARVTAWNVGELRASLAA